MKRKSKLYFEFLNTIGKKVSPSDRKRISLEVLPYLRVISSNGDTEFKLARDIIMKLVVNHEESPVSLVDKLLFLMACSSSIRRLPGYATLDESHIKSIDKLLISIRRYIDDTSQKRPLTFLMLASPGAGKSHFIKCIAKQLAKQTIGAITYNMAGLQNSEDMIPPLDAARNMKVEDRIPLLFLDEFDSSPDNVSRLLPLLWDGEITIGQRELKLGKVIIVVAGSNPMLPTTMEQARSMRPDSQIGGDRSQKLIDLLSRINGDVFSIPPFYDAANNIDRRVDKVCILIQLLKQRFGGYLKEVPFCLLYFVAQTEFRYGVRSIAHLVNLIPYKEDQRVISIKDLKLPLGDPAAIKQSSIAYHLLHHDQAFGVSKMWEKASRTNILLPVATEYFERMWTRHYNDDYLLSMIYSIVALPGMVTRTKS